MRESNTWVPSFYKWPCTWPMDIGPGSIILEEGMGLGKFCIILKALQNTLHSVPLPEP